MGFAPCEGFACAHFLIVPLILARFLSSFLDRCLDTLGWVLLASGLRAGRWSLHSPGCLWSLITRRTASAGGLDGVPRARAGTRTTTCGHRSSFRGRHTSRRAGLSRTRRSGKAATCKAAACKAAGASGRTASSTRSCGESTSGEAAGRANAQGCHSRSSRYRATGDHPALLGQFSAGEG